MPAKTPNPATLWPERPEFAAMPVALRDAASWKSFGKGDLLFAIGESPKFIYFIAQGEVRLRRFSPEGMEMVMQRALNTFLAEASLESPLYHCDAVATEQVQALAFPVRQFRWTLAECANFRDRWISHLLREVRRARAQCERQSLRSADARILHYLEFECPSGCLELTQTKKIWASELGLTHEALYRALARLSQRGVLKVEGRLVERL
ncbi:MAG: Crp/Fnr family transcriptional regulator [Betaproteobacteria bacterium HGW-Betaproteobacteria-12]|nr:MAG: Crp/Fnr family transcriptional regulator [Betaproteobacteria bacterium HGW-Betaproteobacteria-12]